MTEEQAADLTWPKLLVAVLIPSAVSVALFFAIDHRVKESTATLNDALSQQSVAEAEAIRGEERRRSTPSLGLRPFANVNRLGNNAREFNCEMVLANTGEAPVVVKEISVEIYRVRLSPDAARDFRLASQLSRPDNPGTFVDPGVESLRLEIPKMIGTTIDSPDTIAEKVEGISGRREVDLEIAPKEEVSDHFACLILDDFGGPTAVALTESDDLQPWFVMVYTAWLGDGRPRTFRGVIPTAPGLNYLTYAPDKEELRTWQLRPFVPTIGDGNGK